MLVLLLFEKLNLWQMLIFDIVKFDIQSHACIITNKSDKHTYTHTLRYTGINIRQANVLGYECMSFHRNWTRLNSTHLIHMLTHPLLSLSHGTSCVHICTHSYQQWHKIQCNNAEWICALERILSNFKFYSLLPHRKKSKTVSREEKKRARTYRIVVCLAHHKINIIYCDGLNLKEVSEFLFVHGICIILNTFMYTEERIERKRMRDTLMCSFFFLLQPISTALHDWRKGDNIYDENAASNIADLITTSFVTFNHIRIYSVLFLVSLQWF